MNSQTNILSFEAIPVIDLMGGKVVRARRGERDQYQAVVSRLCSGAEPLEVAHALLELYPFRTCYIADLNAIRHEGDHLKICTDLRKAFPDVLFWIDAGFTGTQACQPWLDAGFSCVIGSESQPDAEQAYAMVEALGPQHAILSLDFTGTSLRGPQALLSKPERWPERVIAMTLQRVGSYAGPDVDLLNGIKHQAGSRSLFAAGGLRHADDIRMLKEMGVNGALLASALHDGAINGEDLELMAG